LTDLDGLRRDRRRADVGALVALVARPDADHRLVRYDERGSGLSDWHIPPGSFMLDAWVHDLETVVDTTGLERFAMLGMSRGGPIAVRYAARHPERVSHLIVYGTCARATWAARPKRSDANCWPLAS
jgi:pimeloyl-ACP methyl ester carboxylesterase